MCGRTACGKTPDEICTICAQSLNKENIKLPWKNIDGNYTPSYNKAPQSFNPVLLSSSFIEKNGETDLMIVPMYWTLIPSWFQGGIKNFKYQTINCRKEGINTKTMFKGAIHKNYRCVVLADGYYEWRKVGGSQSKQPYFFYFAECSMVKKELTTLEWVWNCPHLMMLAGIFDIHHKGPDAVPFYSYSIITVPAHPTVAWVHDRMPAILDSKDAVYNWLNPNITSEKALDLIQPYGKLQFHPVSTQVNNVRNHGIELLYPIKIAKSLLPNKQTIICDEIRKNTPEITEYFGKVSPTPVKKENYEFSLKNEPAISDDEGMNFSLNNKFKTEVKAEMSKKYTRPNRKQVAVRRPLKRFKKG